MNQQLYFHLFANCVPVKGIKRSIICDLQQNSFEFIPNELFFILTKLSKKTIREIKTYFDNAFDEIIDEYFEFLIQKKMGRWITSLDKGFVNLKFRYDVPNAITNCIIDVDKTSNHPFPEIVSDLDELGCQALQFRFYDPISPLQLDEYLTYFDDSKIRGIETIMPFQKEFTEDRLCALIEKHPRLLYIVFNGALENKESFLNNEKVKINYTKKTITSSLCCGQISPLYFRVNIKAFSQAKNFNSCLYKKVAIDKNGEIGNCPSLQKKFGNIHDHSLIEAVTDPEFEKNGLLKKDDIAVCKSCEFRYICSDCRAYSEIPQDILSKPLKCGYNPTTCEWEEWSKHPLKQQALDYYKKQ